MRRYHGGANDGRAMPKQAVHKRSMQVGAGIRRPGSIVAARQVVECRPTPGAVVNTYLARTNAV